MYSLFYQYGTSIQDQFGPIAFFPVFRNEITSQEQFELHHERLTLPLIMSYWVKTSASWTMNSELGVVASDQSTLDRDMRWKYETIVFYVNLDETY